MNSGIYKITNNINEKVYIGSAKHIDKRIKKHIRELKNNKHHSRKFQNLYNKYKLTIILNFEVLEYCKESLLIFKEQIYLDSIDYEQLLNINKVANSRLGVKSCQETKDKIRNSLIGHSVSDYTKNEISKKLSGIKLTKERIEKKMKKISQFDNNGNFIRCWESIKKASESLLIDRGRISHCLKNPHLTFLCTYWRFFKENQLKIDILPLKHKRKIGVINNGIVVKEYDSLKDAAINLKVNSSKIADVCSGKRNHTGGYKFIYL